MPRRLAVKIRKRFSLPKLGVWKANQQWKYLTSLFFLPPDNPALLRKYELDFNARLEHTARVATNSGRGIAKIFRSRGYFSILPPGHATA